MTWLRRYRHWAGIAAFAAVRLAALAYPVLQDLFAVAADHGLRHSAAAPNCAAARGRLAPACRGRPGYYMHDRAKDGIACEPWPTLWRGAREAV
jgi:hypothetical protein